MSVIEKLDALEGVRVDVEEGADGLWRIAGSRSDIIKLGEVLRELPAIRQDMIDARRYRWLRDSRNCSLSISHNDHHNMYLSVADTLDEPQGYYSDLSDAERAQMIATDTIWTVHVYPNTPVGFNVYHASTLDAAIDKARATGEGEGHD